MGTFYVYTMDLTRIIRFSVRIKYLWALALMGNHLVFSYLLRIDYNPPPPPIYVGHDSLNKLGEIFLRPLWNIIYNNTVIPEMSMFSIACLLKSSFGIIYCLNLTLVCEIFTMYTNIYIYLLSTGNWFQHTLSIHDR